MVDIRPFKAWHSTPDSVNDCSAPPWDVLTADDVRELAEGKPSSFLYVTRPDALMEGDSHANGKKSLERLLNDGVLVRDNETAYWIYRITEGNHSQLGLMASVGSLDVLEGRVLKHEHTLAKKEDDRAAIITAHGACAEPVFYFCRDDRDLASALKDGSAGPATLENTDEDGAQHELWRVTDPGIVGRLASAFAGHENIYVADGHHRSAGAARYYQKKLEEHGGAHDDNATWTRLLATIFPEDQVQILAYHRLIKDWNGLSADELAAKAGCFTTTPAPDSIPPAGSFDLLIDGDWSRFTINDGIISEETAPEARLDLSVFHDHLLSPVLGITDPRRDDRLDFVGGLTEKSELAAAAQNRGFAGAAWVPAVTAAQLREVAESGAVMPPKSTWFAPKLRSGMLVLPLED